MKPRRSKRVSRPCQDDASDTILSDERRTQVRRAQRIYRLKKEAIFQNATARAKQLDGRMRTAVVEAAGLSQVARRPQLQVSHPDIYALLKLLHEILTDRVVIYPLIPIPPSFPTRQYTYSFQEVRFTRRLQ